MTLFTDKREIIKQAIALAQNALARDYRTVSLRRNWRSEAWTRANSWPSKSQREVKTRVDSGRGNFSREKFIRSVIAEFSVNLCRRDEGVLAKIGFWPKQWSAARMFAQSAKGFHVHPPSIPPDTTAEKWLRRLFVAEPENYSLRRYDDEQWDVMFFLQGRVEMILCDVRAGFPRRIMRFFIDGDNHRGNNNVGVVIPPGVAHAHSRRRRGRCHHGLRNKHDFPSRIRGTHRERNRKRGVAGILAEVFG